MENSKCPSCNKEYAPFRDQKSLAEYRISSLCQSCQDSIWGVTETKPPNGHCPNCGEYYYSEHNKYSPCCTSHCYKEFLASLTE